MPPLPTPVSRQAVGRQCARSNCYKFICTRHDLPQLPDCHNSTSSSPFPSSSPSPEVALAWRRHCVPSVPLPVLVPGRIFNVRLWLQNVFHSIFYVLAPRQPQKAHSAAFPRSSPSCGSLAAWKCIAVASEKKKVCVPNYCASGLKFASLSLSPSLSIFCFLSPSPSLSLTSVCLFLLWQQPKRKVRCTRLAFAFFRSIFFTAAQRGVWATWRETNRPTANGFWHRYLWPMPMLIRWPGTSSTHTHSTQHTHKNPVYWSPLKQLGKLIKNLQIAGKLNEKEKKRIVNIYIGIWLVHHFNNAIFHKDFTVLFGFSF